MEDGVARASALRRTWRRAAAGLLCATSTACAAVEARAGAWNRPAGEGLAIIDYTLDGGTDYFDGQGHLAPARRYGKGEAAAYVEYGLTDSLTLLARPSIDEIGVAEPDGGRYRGLGATSAGIQWQALLFGPAVFAVQGSFSEPGSTARSDPALVGNTARDGELRLLAGANLPTPIRSFVDLQGAFRVRSGRASSEWHGDATVGAWPTDRLLLLFQSFAVASTGRGEPANPGGRATSLGVKAVYALTQRWALQLGLSATVWGREALRERGFTTGVWYYF